MFPLGKSLFLVKKDGASIPNYLMIQAINISTAIELPVSGLENYKISEVAQYVSIWLDDKPLTMTSERLLSDLSLWSRGYCLDSKYLERMIKGCAEQFIIPIGAKFSILLRIGDDMPGIRNFGPHSFKIILQTTEFIAIIEVPLELTKENSNLVFNPAST